MTMTLTAAAYQALPGISSHSLIEVLKSPADCWQQYVNPHRSPQPSSSSMRLGTLVHALALTPYRLDREVLVADYERRSHAGKARYADLLRTGRCVVKPSELENARAIVAVLKANKDAHRLIHNGKKERVIVQPRPAGRLPLKGRLDVHDEARRQVVELKTIRDLGLVKMAMQRYGYPLSATFYQDLACAQRMMWVFVQTTPPYEIALIEMDQATLAEGRDQYRTALHRFDTCWQSGQWPEADPVPDFDDDPLMMPTSPTRHARYDVPVGELAL